MLGKWAQIVDRGRSTGFIRAEHNLDKWGLQDPDTLILAMTEELGELAQAQLQSRADRSQRPRVREECVDLMALCLQLYLRESVDAGNDGK